MAVERLEVYVDSYRTRPFIQDFDNAIAMTPSDEALLEDWIGLLSGRNIRIDRDLKIEDVKHYFPGSIDGRLCSNVEALVHATCIRVSLVD